MLAPFRGVRYAENRVTGLAEVTSPPYDVIAADNESQLMAADPHNVVRLILPRHQAGQPGSPYEDAAAELASWLADGILAPDPAPALYVYEQSAAGHGVLQRGLIGALRLEPYTARIVQPHEDVAPGPVIGRRQLMEATLANLEPIFLLYQGGNGAATRLVDAIAGGREPLAEACTADGLRHRLWAITDPDELSAIAADLAPRTALIADGHHRYAAYLQLPGPAAAGRRGRRAVGLRARPAGGLDCLPAAARGHPPGGDGPGAGGRGAAGVERVRGARAARRDR